MNIDLPAKSDAIRRLALSESGFVFDPGSGQSFTVNETGLLLLRQLQKSSDIETILDTLNEQYIGDRQEIRRDLEEFVTSLSEQLGLQ